MSNEREEKLRAVLASLRRRDETSTPPFATMWANAQRRSMADAPINYRKRWAFATGLVFLCIVVAVSYRGMHLQMPTLHAPQVSLSDAPHRLDQFDQARAWRWQSGSPYVDPVTAWRSPTQMLLSARNVELWRGMPRFESRPIFSHSFSILEI